MPTTREHTMQVPELRRKLVLVEACNRKVVLRCVFFFQNRKIGGLQDLKKILV